MNEMCLFTSEIFQQKYFHNSPEASLLDIFIHIVKWALNFWILKNS